LKRMGGNTIYSIGDTKLGKSLEEAIQTVEEDQLEDKLEKEVITLWKDIESQFDSNRKRRVLL